MNKISIIAEIGVNHNGDIKLALEMIEAAKESGVDAVKFQTFQADQLAHKQTPKVNYQINTTDDSESHYEMLKRLELSHENHLVIFDYCQKLGLEILSTPYGVEDVNFLESLGVSKYKVASADIVDFPLLKAIGKTGGEVLLSTGMSTLGEVDDAIQVLKNSGSTQIVLLHCVSNYPCAAQSMNLRAIPLLKNTFQLPIGFSDHSEGTTAAILSVAMDVCVIEKHFTLDRQLPGPDHAASSEPAEFKAYCEAIRIAEIMMGEARKFCQQEEQQMRSVSRKSLTLKRDMQAGELLTAQDLMTMRPGTGLYAKYLPEIIGMRLRKDLTKFHQIRWSDLEEITD